MGKKTVIYGAAEYIYMTIQTQSKARILVVEDEPASALHIETRLEFMRYQVTATVASGEEALARVEQDLPDLALMDIHLAGALDGIQTAEKLRERWNIPVIYLTSYDDEATLHRAKITSPFGYLLKPFSERELHHAIEIALYKSRVEREQQQAEEERRQLEQQLRHAQKLESIGILAGGIAHDFNNILGTMMGYTELLMAEIPQGQKEYAYLEQVYLAGERATDLVQRMLTFSRSHDQQHVTPTDVGAIMSEALKMLRAMIPSSIEIQCRIQPDCRPVMADSTQIHQVVVNLCINAFHAMRERGGTLTMSLKEIPAASLPHSLLENVADAAVKLSIRDTGRGMTADVQERIFDPFFTTKEPGEGVGLGLSVVHGIVTSHGGSIQVVSRPAEGTTFDIYFPVADQPVSPSRSRLPEEISTPERGLGRILLVEDETALARLYDIGLTRLGYRVTRCANGREALNVFRANPQDFDLVFTDQTMPRITGSQLSRELLSIRSDIPIILSTGYSDTIAEDTALALGIRAYLTKPVKVRALLHTIQNILQ